MKDRTEYVHQRDRILSRLRDWGDYERNPGTGVFPKPPGPPVYGKMAGEMGAARRLGIKQRANQVSATLIHSTASEGRHREEMRTDEAIKSMGTDLQQVAWENFVQNDRNQSESAAKLSISRSEFNNRLSRVIDFLIGYFYKENNGL